MFPFKGIFSQESGLFIHNLAGRHLTLFIGNFTVKGAFQVQNIKDCVFNSMKMKLETHSCSLADTSHERNHTKDHRAVVYFHSCPSMASNPVLGSSVKKH